MSLDGDSDILDINDRASPEEAKRDESIDVIRGVYPSKPPMFRYIPSKEQLR